MTAREREQFTQVITDLRHLFDNAKTFAKECPEDAQYWEGVQGGAATALNKLNAILD